MEIENVYFLYDVPIVQFKVSTCDENIITEDAKYSFYDVPDVLHHGVVELL